MNFLGDAGKWTVVAVAVGTWECAGINRRGVVKCKSHTGKA